MLQEAKILAEQLLATLRELVHELRMLRGELQSRKGKEAAGERNE